MWGCSVWGQGFHLNICLIHWEWLYLAQLAGWSCRMPHKLRGANKPNKLYNWASQLQMNSCTYKTDLLSPLLQSASLFCFPRTNSGNKCHYDERFENFDARTHHQFCQSNSQIHQKRWGQELILCIFTTGVLPFFHVSAAGKQTHGCNRFWENPVEVVQGFGLVHIPVVSIFCWVFLTDTCVCVSVAICCIYMWMRIKQGGVYAFCWVTSFYINGILSEMSLTWQLAWMWMYYLLFDSTTST